MKKILLTLFFNLLSYSIIAQVYDTVIIHSGSFGKYGDKYMINGKEVHEDVFFKYDQEFKIAKTCCPCVIQVYSLSEILQAQQIKCNDTLKSAFNLFKNGAPKYISHYLVKDNTYPHYSLGIDDVYASDGDWVELDPLGDTISMTTWQNGVFVSKLPKVKTSNIWGLKAKYNGKPLLRDVTEITNFQGFKLKPMYMTFNHKAVVHIFISITDSKSNTWEVSATHKSLKKLNLNQISKENNIILDENTRIWIRFMNESFVTLGGKMLKYGENNR